MMYVLIDDGKSRVGRSIEKPSNEGVVADIIESIVGDMRHPIYLMSGDEDNPCRCEDIDLTVDYF